MELPALHDDRQTLTLSCHYLELAQRVAIDHQQVEPPVFHRVRRKVCIRNVDRLALLRKPKGV